VAPPLDAHVGTTPQDVPVVKEEVGHRVDPGCTADTSYAIRKAA